MQFTLVTAEAGPTWQAGQVLALPDGSPAVWSLPGTSSEWTNNYNTPYFTVHNPHTHVHARTRMYTHVHIHTPYFTVLQAHTYTHA